MKISAVTLDTVGGPVRVETLDLGEPREGEVLVKMGAAGICHSDQHVVTGQHVAPLPCVLGHEGAGEVVAVGPNVSATRPGDRVALNWVPSCKNCFFCARKQHHLCPEITQRIFTGFMADGTSRISRSNQPVLHYSGISTWADHMVVPAECCQILDPRVPFEVAAVVGCAVATGVGAAMHRGNIQVGDRIVVVGAGGVGLSAVMGAKMAGAGQIIAVDREPKKRRLAEELGATHFVQADAHAVQEIYRLTDDRGADVVLEAIGNTALQEEWLEAVRPGGSLVLVGVPSTSDATEFISANLIRSEKTIKGSYYAATDPGQAISDLCTAYLDGHLPVDRLISKRVPIEDVQLAIDAMLTGVEGRTVIIFD
ncbi:MAG: zinc-binding dehydrogenase [Actinomycetota bacterium]|nr:zinc-binding dehydrogenase [Actinomycetota bacterium]